MKNNNIPTLADIQLASEKLKEVVTTSSLEYSERLSKKYNAEIFIKREDLQSVRSFKIRGAYNKISNLTKEERGKGVVCASAGNHAQGVAISCSKLKTRGVIFMPKITPNQKIEKVRNFGKQYITIELIGTTFDEASKAAQKYCKDHNMIYVHPFNDPLTIAGQGTIGLEIIDQLKSLDKKPDYILSPVGGGGIASGVAIATKTLLPKTKIITCEPVEAAGMYHSLKAKKVITLETMSTFVDGAAVATVGDLTFEICKEYTDKSMVVSEGEVCASMIDLYQYEGIVTEPAGVLSIATLDQIADKIKGKVIVCILSGGNNDLLRYPEILEKSLVYKGLKHYFIINFAQKPGQLKALVNDCLGPTDDIVRFEYIKKNNKEKGPALIGIELSKKEDFNPLINRLNKFGINYKLLNSQDILYDYLI
jgi:threonine dehydratase